MNLTTKCLAILILLLFSANVFAADTVVNEQSGAEYKAGIEAYQQGNYSLAITHFVKARELDDRNVAAAFAQGLALLKQNEYSKAAKIFETVLGKEPDHEKAARMFPYALDKAGNAKESLAAYDRVIALHPENAGLYWGKARVLIQQEKPEEAIPLLNKAIDLDDDNPELFETLSIALYRVKKYGEALAANDRALSLNPDDLENLYFKAQIQSESGKLKDAYDTAVKVLEKNPDHARARLISADYKRQTGMLDEALADYEIAAKNIDARAYASHFIELIKQQKEEEAIEQEYQERLKNSQQ